jgi:hypothetical protein
VSCRCPTRFRRGPIRRDCAGQTNDMSALFLKDFRVFFENRPCPNIHQDACVCVCVKSCHSLSVSCRCPTRFRRGAQFRSYEKTRSAARKKSQRRMCLREKAVTHCLQVAGAQPGFDEEHSSGITRRRAAQPAESPQNVCVCVKKLQLADGLGPALV